MREIPHPLNSQREERIPSSCQAGKLQDVILHWICTEQPRDSFLCKAELKRKKKKVLFCGGLFLTLSLFSLYQIILGKELGTYFLLY